MFSLSTTLAREWWGCHEICSFL